MRPLLYGTNSPSRQTARVADRQYRAGAHYSVGRSEMASTSRDPYETLGVSPNAPDAEVRSAYRRLVKQYHPDHNGGSEASEQRFEEVQEAYARIRELRKSRTAGAQAPPPPRRPGRGQPPRPPFDPDVEARMAKLEQELRQANEARERARRAAAEAAAASYKRPTDEELGYVTTDDSFSKILSDARSELSEKLSGAREGAREHPVAQRVSDLIDELEALLSKATRDRHE